MERIARRVVVPAALAGKRLDQAAAELLDEFSRSRLRAWIDAGQLTVAGAVTAPKTRLRGGEELCLDAELTLETPVAAEPIPLRVLYRDAALLVVDKPAGLVVHPGAGNRSGTLQNALLNLDPALACVPRAGLVHRLDKDTSGLLLVARTVQAHTVLAAEIANRRVERRYRAVCQGVLTGGGEIDAPIGRHRRDRLKMAVTEGGRPARTRYTVLERFRAHTFVQLQLDTGRTHQIRVHMAYVRAPLVGDPVYGGRPRWPKRPTAALQAALSSFNRQALHAVSLRLRHPGSGEPLEFASPLPADFRALLDALREDFAAAGRS